MIKLCDEIILSLFLYLDLKTLISLARTNRKFMTAFIKRVLKDGHLLSDSLLKSDMTITKFHQVRGVPRKKLNPPFKLHIKHYEDRDNVYFIEGLGVKHHGTETYEMVKTTVNNIKSPYLKLEKIINGIVHEDCIGCRAWYYETYIRRLTKIMNMICIPGKKNNTFTIFKEEEDRTDIRYKVMRRGKYKGLAVIDVERINIGYLKRFVKYPFDVHVPHFLFNTKLQEEIQEYLEAKGKL